MKLQRITKKREEMFLNIGEESKNDSTINMVAYFGLYSIFLFKRQVIFASNKKRLTSQI